MMWGSVCPIHPELEGERHNGGNCPECVKITKAAYLERTREKRAAEMKVYREKNKDRVAELNKAWVAENRDYVRCSNLRRAGFTLALKNQCIEMQDGKCAICRTELHLLHRREVHADHCHGTGMARGVLCHRCNTGLGAFRDDPKRLLRAIEYLKTPTLEPLV